MSSKEQMILALREELKRQRDILLASGDPELELLGQSLNSYLICTYNMDVLLKLGDTLTSFLNNQIGGQS